MPSLGSLISNPAALAATAAVCVGFAAFWANPRRSLNRVFLSASLHAVLWLVCRELAGIGGPQGQKLMRVAVAIGAIIPFHLWLLKETIVVSGQERLRGIFIRGIPWLLVCLALAAIAFTEWMVPTQTGAQMPKFETGYYVYIAGLVIMYGQLCRESVRQMRTLVGASRLELQIVLLGGSIAAITVIALMGLREIYAAAWITPFQTIIVLIFYAWTAIAITTTRILDARQIFYIGVQKIALVAFVTTAAFVLNETLLFRLPVLMSLLTCAGLASIIAIPTSKRLAKIFNYFPESTEVRKAAFSVAQRETRSEHLVRAFRNILNGWGQTENSIVVSGGNDTLSGSDISLTRDSPVVGAMRTLRWATPERLIRERRTPERGAVADFLKLHNLGVLVLEEGPAFSSIVGVGTGASRQPFTYPQVTQLVELASIIESALERAHFSAKAQHTEQLATVGLLGASLAHEIRNPLVSIKTFVQLLPTHYGDAAFRDKFFKLISNEVNRIDQLTEQLLDLSAPRSYLAQPVELHILIKDTLELVSAKSLHKQIDLNTDFRASPDVASTDASAAKQVILNLCFNAIQAIENHNAKERWIAISTRNTEGGIELLVEDSGPGISPEIRPRLFQPFQTTKSTGFGLGLAICSDILGSLQATISVDPFESGRGATFRVKFPCQPSSS
ncbi:sensor histidine kinase [Horticoccus sp. 23ND18S-11]|uniref:sensor histidine kinase n=1 Tax=Horticoccus sp. 23ND18S-11 TaxID=3391832 RepID=UPI0039C8EDF0